MPGVVSLASPTQVLPFSLCTAYQRAKKWEILSNTYSDGSMQRSSLVGSDRSTWVLSKRLTTAQITILQSFYQQMLGSTKPFYFYDFLESHFAYDPSGTQGLGRYIVRFEGPWSVSFDIARLTTQFTLIQID